MPIAVIVATVLISIASARIACFVKNASVKSSVTPAAGATPVLPQTLYTKIGFIAQNAISALIRLNSVRNANTALIAVSVYYFLL